MKKPLSSLNADQLNFKKGGGFITAIAQDEATGTVLMVGVQNEEALRQTQATGRLTFFSRTRGKIWEKGETSGNTLHVTGAAADCDADAVLYQVAAPKATCHRGDFSCFGDKMDVGVLRQLEAIIQLRKAQMPKESYTAQLLASGAEKLAQKVGEEGVEVAVAALAQTDQRVAEESADLLFHLLALLAKRGMSLAQVEAVLRGRMEKGE